LLDDGFQHRRLARDVDVLIDAGHGNGRLLPAGPMREPQAASARASLVVGRDGQRGDIEVTLSTNQLRAPDGTLMPLQGPMVLLTAIARPARVLRSLAEAGIEVVGSHCFPDHHQFTRDEVAAAEREARAHRALLVTTAKDAERLESPPHVLVQTLSVTKGAELLDQLVSDREKP
jgi:tetraacyldisaccharide 4'-kinase